MRISSLLAICFMGISIAGCHSVNPEEVCSQVEQVYSKDPSASKYAKFDKASCLSSGNLKKEMPFYAEYAGCVKKATTIENLNECSKQMNATIGAK